MVSITWFTTEIVTHELEVFEHHFLECLLYLLK